MLKMGIHDLSDSVSMALLYASQDFQVVNIGNFPAGSIFGMFQEKAPDISVNELEHFDQENIISDSGDFTMEGKIQRTELGRIIQDCAALLYNLLQHRPIFF